jgi:DNA-binding LacI/PurR family transcriptional regulator/GAF domain-containing protein
MEWLFAPRQPVTGRQAKETAKNMSKKRVGNKPKSDRKSKSGEQKSRPTIALITDQIVYEYQAGIWSGVIATARERDANLICFVGGRLHSSTGFEGQGNVVYDLVSAESVDGLVIMTGAVGSQVAPEETRAFCEGYRSLPMVSVGLVLEGIPSVLVDNEKGLRDVLIHLIEDHGRRRIAFIRGPVTNEEAELRYRTYVNVLSECGLPLDSDLVAHGDFLRPSGMAAINLLLDERRVDFEAVVAANDSMALGALEALQAREIRVPYDVTVVGFDDVEETRFVTPPLTTVRQPLYRQGQQATEMLLALLAGEEVPERVTLPTEALIRQSCGCLSPVVLQAEAGQVVRRVDQTFEAALAARRESILSEMVQAAGIPAVGSIPEQVEQLVDAFSVELTGKSPGAFLLALGEILGQAEMEDGDRPLWQEAISTLRRHALPYLGDDETRSRVEDLWQQARVMIGETAERVQAYKALQGEQQAQMLRQIEASLITTFDVGALMDVLAGELPGLGLPSVYLSLYEDPQPYAYPDPAPGRSRLMLAYTEEGRVELPSGGLRFPSRQLVPEGMWFGRPYSYVAEPLYFREDQSGFALFGVGSREGMVYETLRGQISSALQGARLVQQVEERSRALQEANYALQRRAIELEASAEVGRAITSIFDVDELTRQTVDLIRDRFDFYHAGIFLLDETREWAVLQEATGEAGEQMKAQGHRLAVEDTSMVGWTALHRQARIALDVGEDAVHFANPLLPNTRSEMALPLMVGDRLLGVLNVQSTEEAAFDQDDVRALQSMADQVAIAIENARRVSDEAALLEATSPIYRASRHLTTATTTDEVAEAIIASVAETDVDGCLVVEFEFSPGGEPEALLYRGVWRRDREPQFKTGLRLPITDSPFPLEMVSTLWAVADVEQDDRLPRSARVVFQATGAQALVNIPLRSGERVIGQVVVIRATPGPFPDTALRLYEVLSDQAAVALERAQLLEQTQQRAAQEQRARQMIDRIRRAPDVEQALQVAAEELSQAMDVPHVSVELGVEAPTHS